MDHQPNRWGAAAAALLALCWPAAASAFDWSKGDFTVRIDSLLSIGTSIRTSERDCEQIATINGGCNPLAALTAPTYLATEGQLLNQDDGNLNWDQWDVFSVLLKGTHEAQADWRNYGAFVRFTWFADFIQMRDDTSRRTDLSDDARFRSNNLLGGVVGAHFLLLDAYIDGNWDVGERYFNARLGNQVINWGESLFQQGGINSINTLDVTKIRLPGSELKEALLPAPIVKLAGDIVPNLGFELYYQFAWLKYELDPVGTFFSTSDLVSRGAQGQFNPPFCGDPGTPDENRIPVFGCVPPYSVDQLTRFPLGIPFLGFRDASDQRQYGASLRYYLDSIQTELATYFIRLHHKFPVVEFSGTMGNEGLCPGGPPTPNPSCNLGYSVIFPEDISLAGFSFNTLLADISIGGEISYRWDQPTPVTFDNGLCNADNLAACAAAPNRFANQESLINSLRAVGSVPTGGGVVPGFVRTDRLVAVLNALYIFSPGTAYVGLIAELLQADEMTAIVEFAVTHYPSLRQCPVDGVTPGCRRYPTPFGVDKVDATGWGYSLRFMATYNRIFGTPIAFLPALSFSHNVSGITPPSEAGFTEKVLGLGATLEFRYLERWSGLVSYSNSFGAGPLVNGNNDRDFLGVTVTYQF